MKGWRSEIDDINGTIIKFGDEVGVTTVVKNFQVPPESVTVQIVESKKDSEAKGGVPFTER
jgi:hypothetical protein